MSLGYSHMEFDYCKCEIGTYHGVASINNMSADYSSLLQCNHVPAFRWVFTIGATMGIIFLPSVTSCKPSYLIIGLNVGLISITALNILWSYCILSTIAKKEKDQPLLGKNNIEPREIQKSFLSSIKNWEICSIISSTTIIFASIILTAINC